MKQDKISSTDGRKRVVIENVQPAVDGGRYPAKAVIGDKIEVLADAFTDGHDEIAVILLYRKKGHKKWQEVPMAFQVNDRWAGHFIPARLGLHEFTVQAWMDHFHTWQKDLRKKFEAGQDVHVDLQIGTRLLEDTSKRASKQDAAKLLEWIQEIGAATDMAVSVSLALSEELTNLMQAYPDRKWATAYEKELTIFVEPERARFSSWYELFPRSCSSDVNQHGTFKDCERFLPEIAEMGFDVLYLPPIHPVGRTKRKGLNNSPVSEPGDPGSPWAIGASEGGHKAVHPELGTMEDFVRLVASARELGIDVALDIAFQCSPDHPWVAEHPKWFRWRPDGTVQYAENPPKKYEDILPLNFESEDWKGLWKELRNVFLFWIQKGVRVFRVDNPHTKAFPFWEWAIGGIKARHPEVIFLSEAFTRPKVMYRLAKLGFSQSYTYFTWRNTKTELTTYLTDLTQTEVADFFRPNFWPNTPDILPEYLQYGGRPAFIIRLVLAATLSSNYGIYGAPYELCIGEAVTGKEEYLHSEKYEVKHWNRDQPGNLRSLIRRINQIRKSNTALHYTRNLQFMEIDNENLLAYVKFNPDFSETFLIVVNLDPYHTHAGWVRLPLSDLDISSQNPYLVHDLLAEEKYIWNGEKNYVELNPHVSPAAIFKIRRRLKREVDFDYFM